MKSGDIGEDQFKWWIRRILGRPEYREEDYQNGKHMQNPYRNQLSYNPHKNANKDWRKLPYTGIKCYF